MDIIQLIHSILQKSHSHPDQINICIKGKVYSFYNGISVIDCNKDREKLDYEIQYINNKNTDISNENLSSFSLIDKLKEKISEENIKYWYYLDDKTKTSFSIALNNSFFDFKQVYEQIKEMALPPQSQYIFASVDHVEYLYFFNQYFMDDRTFNQKLMKYNSPKKYPKDENYIDINLCHDFIHITKNDIHFGDKDSLKIIAMILPLINVSMEDIFIEPHPPYVLFHYPIAINLQLFDYMLYHHHLHYYIYTNESSHLLQNLNKITYTIDVFDTSVKMTICKKYGIYTEVFLFQTLKWYMYRTIKIILDQLYILYVNFHKNWEKQYQHTILEVETNINYNRVFGKYYTRHFNNIHKVLPVMADKEYCEENNIKYVEWNGNYYMAPENTGYSIILNYDNEFFNENNKGIPKCVKKIKKNGSSTKKQMIYFNLSRNLDNHIKGKFPESLFILYGFGISDHLRNHLDIEYLPIEFKICPKCQRYMRIPLQMEIVKIIKEEIKQLKWVDEEEEKKETEVKKEIKVKKEEEKEEIKIKKETEVKKEIKVKKEEKEKKIKIKKEEEKKIKIKKEKKEEKSHKKSFQFILRPDHITDLLMMSDEEKSRINILAFSVDEKSQVFPYAIDKDGYSFNSKYPFLIVMLNTTKMYGHLNDRFEYITYQDSPLFKAEDKIVKAILTMYQKSGVSVMDHSSLINHYIGQFLAEDEERTLLLATKNELSNGKYLTIWHSMTIPIIPHLRIVDTTELMDTLPTLTDLYDYLSDTITAYHYLKDNKNNLLVYGVWANKMYYPCVITNEKHPRDLPNLPYLLFNRDEEANQLKEKHSKANFIIYN